MSTAPLGETQEARATFAEIAASRKLSVSAKDTVIGTPGAYAAPQQPDASIVSMPSTRVLQRFADEEEKHAAIQKRLPTQNGALAGDASNRNGAVNGEFNRGSSDGTNYQASSSNASSKSMTRYDDGTLLSSAASALDEKESLRPDDSASLKAVEDEDVHNYPAFGTGHGQTVFANIAPPFQDQLNEISVAGAASTPTRGLPLWQPTNDQGNDATYPTPTPFVLNRQLLGAVDGNSLYGSSMALPGPDQKLVDALESLRDRVFVLKLEENIISFITGSRNTSFELPQSNSFHRMLAHRLADYYLLGHTVDVSLGAVRLHRTPYCRLPPPISSMAKPMSINAVAQPEMPARIIMRRTTDSPGDPTAGAGSILEANALSNSASELGGDSSSDGGNASSGGKKSKAALTREEREVKYNEARQRIFGAGTDADEVEGADDVVNKEGLSRSSSSSGRKKARKPRPSADNDFEARSQFSSYRSADVSPSVYSDMSVYGTFGVAPNGSLSHAPPNLPGQPYPASIGHFPAHDMYRQPGWPAHPFIATNNAEMTPFDSVPCSSVDRSLSQDFQRAMSSMQSSTDAPNSLPPHTLMNDFARLRGPPGNHVWPISANSPPAGPYQPVFPPDASDRVHSGAYYQHYVPYRYPNPYGMQYGTPYGHPGATFADSMGRQQFNPRTKDFIPAGQAQRIPGPQTAAFQNGNLNAAGGPAYPTFREQYHPSQLPGLPNYGVPRNGDGSRVSATSPGSQPLAHPLPQPVSSATSGHSSIAKWGTPPHLPPKPPPSVSMSPPSLDSGSAQPGFSAFAGGGGEVAGVSAAAAAAAVGSNGSAYGPKNGAGNGISVPRRSHHSNAAGTR